MSITKLCSLHLRDIHAKTLCRMTFTSCCMYLSQPHFHELKFLSHNFYSPEGKWKSKKSIKGSLSQLSDCIFFFSDSRGATLYAEIINNKNDMFSPLFAVCSSRVCSPELNPTETICHLVGPSCLEGEKNQEPQGGSGVCLRQLGISTPCDITQWFREEYRLRLKCCLLKYATESQNLKHTHCKELFGKKKI